MEGVSSRGIYCGIVLCLMCDYIQCVSGAVSNTKLKIVTILENPYTMLKKGGSSQGKLEYEGFIPDLLDEITRLLDVEYELHLVPDGRYGAPSMNGSWNGMIREVLDKKADMAAAGLTISYLRSQVVDFSMPFQNMEVTMLMRKASGSYHNYHALNLYSSYINFAFLAPFSLGVWLLVGFMFILVSVCLWLLNRFHPREWGQQTDLSESEQHLKGALSLPGAFWFTFTIMQWQGHGHSPRSLAGRLVTGLWMGFVTVTLTVYTASMVALVWSANDPKPFIQTAPIDDLHHLVTSHKYQYGCINGGSTYSYFNSLWRNKDYQTMADYWKTAEGGGQMVSTTKQGIDRALRGDYVFLTESTTARLAVNRYCQLTMVDSHLPRSFGFPVPNGSPYKALLDNAILKLKEDGTIDALERRYWDSDMCQRDRAAGRAAKDQLVNLITSGTPRAIPMGLFWGLLVVMAAGLVLGVLVAVGEVIYHKKHSQASPESVDKSKQMEL